MTSHTTASSIFHIQFPRGHAPDAEAVAGLLEKGGEASGIFTITHRCETGDCLEILASGLTFDLSGLDGAAPPPLVKTHYGVAHDIDTASFSWIRLSPGEHLSGGRAQVPVVRVMAAVVLALLELQGAAGVVWEPARTIMSADHFRRIVPGWLKGGAFPGLGLTALIRDTSGAVHTEGLRFFAGLELRIDPLLTKQPGLAGKIAVRLIHSLVEGWKVNAPVEVEGPDGEILGIAPEENGTILKVWPAR